MVGMFPTIVGTYSIRELAEEHAELLRKHAVQAVVMQSHEWPAWVVVVSVAQYPRAAKLTRDLRNP